MPNKGDSKGFDLRASDHLNLKLLIFSGHTESFKIGVSKVQDFGNFELSPMRT